MAFLAFSVWTGITPGRNFHLTTQGKPAAFNGQLAKTATEFTTESKFIKRSRPCGLKRGDGTTPPPRKTNGLLDFHLRAGFFQLLLGGVGISLVRAFQQGLWSAFHQSFRFGKTQTGLHFTDSLDDGDLLVGRNRGEDHVKSVFGGGRCSGTTGSRSGSGN